MNIGMLKKFILIKTVMLMALISVFNFLSCDYYGNEQEFKREITVETNLSFLEINGLTLEFNTGLPYLINSETSPNTGLHFYQAMISPTPDTGIVRFYIYGGDGNHNSKLSFKDSITIYAPMDTTYIEANEYHFLRN